MRQTVKEPETDNHGQTLHVSHIMIIKQQTTTTTNTTT